MDSKIIEVLDYLSEKIGIAIDWTADNIYPQVTDFISRFRTYNIVNDIIWIVISVIILFAIFYIAKFKMLPAYNNAISTNDCNLWFDYDGEWTPLSLIFGVVGGVLAVTFIIFSLTLVDDMIKWIYIPEYQIYNEITDLMG